MVQFCTPAEVAATGYSGTEGTAPVDNTLCQVASEMLLEAVRNDLLDPDFVLTTNWDDVVASVKVRAGYGQYLLLPPYQAGSVLGVADMANVAIDPLLYTEGEPWSLRRIGDPWATNASLWNGQYYVTAKWGMMPKTLKQVAIELVVNIHRSAKSGQFTDMLGVNDGGKIALFGRLDSLQKANIENFVQQIRRVARYE